MFKRKEKNEVFNSNSGIYKFEFPYLSHHNVPLEDGLVPIYKCDVEIHVGDQRDLDNGILASVIIGAKQNGVGTTNFIEHLATKVRKNFIREIIRGDFDEISTRIRWVERNHYPKENYKLVKLDWNKEEERYCNPDWGHIDDSDWIITENRMETYE